VPAIAALFLVTCADDDPPVTPVDNDSPICRVAPDTIDFGPVPVGQTADRSFTIQNLGRGTLAGDVAAYCPRFSIVGARDYVLNAGEIDTFAVRFAPTSEGARTCVLNTGPATCDDIVANGVGYVAPPPPVFPATVTRALAGRYEVAIPGSDAIDIANLCIGDYIFDFGYRGYFDRADDCSATGTLESFVESCYAEYVGSTYVRWTQYGTGQLRGDTLFLAATYTYYRYSEFEGAHSDTTRISRTLVRIGEPDCP